MCCRLEIDFHQRSAPFLLLDVLADHLSRDMATETKRPQKT